jgi:hypothetical protein
VISDDADAELRQLVDQADFAHRDAARHARLFRASGDVAQPGRASQRSAVP